MNGAVSTVEVLGIPVTSTSWLELRDDVVARARARIETTIMYANVHVVNLAQGDAELRAALRDADVVYCDGEGVRLGARILGGRLPCRMTGADFIDDLARALARAGLSVYWLGGRPGVAAAALEVLATRAPGLRVAGSHHGYLSGAADTAAVLEEIAAARPDVLIVGMGTPLQEAWVLRHRARVAAPVVWCVGATADFVVGAQRRGPPLLTRNGFEWLARFVHEPRRMFGRYVVGNPVFVARAIRARVRGLGGLGPSPRR